MNGWVSIGGSGSGGGAGASGVKNSHGASMDFGPLQRLVADERVTDVLVTCDGTVWVDRGLGVELEHPTIPLDSPATVRRLAVQLCAQLGCRLDDAQPIADASAADGTRIHAVIAPIVPYGASLSIRLPNRIDADFAALASARCWPEQWGPILECLVAKQANILITGCTGAGKTTLLKALLSRCESSERIVVIEEVRELQHMMHENMVSLASRGTNVGHKCGRCGSRSAVGLGEIVATHAPRQNRGWGMPWRGGARPDSRVELGAQRLVHHIARQRCGPCAGAFDLIGIPGEHVAGGDGESHRWRLRRGAAYGTAARATLHRPDRRARMRGWAVDRAHGERVERIWATDDRRGVGSVRYAMGNGSRATAEPCA